MASKFSRTVIEGGKPSVELFATGEACIKRQIDMLEELKVNNAGNEPLLQNVATAANALVNILLAVKRVTKRGEKVATPEVAGKPQSPECNNEVEPDPQPARNAIKNAG